MTAGGAGTGALSDTAAVTGAGWGSGVSAITGAGGVAATGLAGAGE
jgi:hypothetical protein